MTFGYHGICNLACDPRLEHHKRDCEYAKLIDDYYRAEEEIPTRVILDSEVQVIMSRLTSAGLEDRAHHLDTLLIKRNTVLKQQADAGNVFAGRPPRDS